MVSVVVHAGSYKTATSSIQLIANANRDVLLREARLFYPETGLRRNTGSRFEQSRAHHVLVHKLRNDVDGKRRKDIAGVARALREEVRRSGCRRVLISTELLTSADAAFKARFIEEYLGFSDDVSILYAIRRPDEYVDSLNNQALKSGKLHQGKKRRIPFREDVEAWIGLVGAENVRVRYFSKRSAGDFVRDVFRDLGAELDALGISTRINDNPALDLRGYALRKAIFRASGLRLGTLSHDDRLKLLEGLGEIDDLLDKGPKLVTISQDYRRELLESQRADLAFLSDRMSEDDRADCLRDMATGHPDPAPQSNMDEEVAFSAREVEDVLSRLLADCRLYARDRT